VPFVRGRDIGEWTELGVHFGHVGIYGYRRDVLSRWASLSATALEDSEKLEQLRLLAHGITIDVYEVAHQLRTTLSVDSPADLETARRLVSK
jgi:3-deoxy-manno-octulosonate cytidylyltransferase (CMP-KDO synthetase)